MSATGATPRGLGGSWEGVDVERGSSSAPFEVPLVRVLVPSVSVDLYFANVANLADAIRHMWVVVGDLDGMLPFSAEDAAVTEDLFRIYRRQGEVVAAQAAEAKAHGAVDFTLDVDFPAGALEHLDHLLGLFDRIDQMVGEQGLGVPASREVRDFRRALVTAMADQLRGAGPPSGHES